MRFGSAERISSLSHGRACDLRGAVVQRGQLQPGVTIDAHTTAHAQKLACHTAMIPLRRNVITCSPRTLMVESRLGRRKREFAATRHGAAQTLLMR